MVYTACCINPYNLFLISSFCRNQTANVFFARYIFFTTKWVYYKTKSPGKIGGFRLEITIKRQYHLKLENGISEKP